MTSGAVGGSALEALQLKNACTSVWESALNPFYWSDNGGIATIEHNADIPIS